MYLTELEKKRTEIKQGSQRGKLKLGKLKGIFRKMFILGLWNSPGVYIYQPCHLSLSM